jgi:glycosyltransferase involved in cell wall biosynthesis
MRVCFITGELPPMEGGVGDYTHEIASALAARDVAVWVVTSKLSSEEMTKDYLRDTSPLGYEVERAVDQWGWSCWPAISDVVKRVSPDVVHVQYQAAAYDMHPAINLLPLRNRLLGNRQAHSVVTFHDLHEPYLFPKAGRLRWQSILSLAKYSDAVVVTNSDDERRLTRHSVTSHLIPIGSNIAPVLADGFDRVAERQRWGVGPEDTLLSHFGFVNDRKGIDTLLRSLRKVADSDALSGSVRLLMLGGKVGSSDPSNLRYLNQIEALVAQLDLQSHITWTGFVEPSVLSAGFAASDICVLPYKDGASFRHGTLMAALAHGLCIVTTRLQGAISSPNQSELEDEDAAVLVSPESAEELGAAIVMLAKDPVERSRLSLGAKRVSGGFSWRSIADRHLEVYDTLA